VSLQNQLQRYPILPRIAPARFTASKDFSAPPCNGKDVTPTSPEEAPRYAEL
jgi:hypothetical protein